MAGEPLSTLVISSIGTARPRDAASVALGLGVAVPEILTAFYQAPTALAHRLPESTAHGIADLLTSLGCEIDVVPADSPPPPATALLDVAVHIDDEARFDDIAAAAADFLGCTTDEAARLLCAMPPVLLGRVSRATVDALRDRLGDGAGLIVSDPQLARYDVLLGDCPPVERTRLLADLRRDGHEPSETTGAWLLRGLAKADADRVWSHHRRTPGLQITNQDFYRFEVVLDAGAPGEAATAALTDAGVPADVVPRLFSALPVIVADRLTEEAARETVARLAAAGLDAHAELTTFLQLGVRVTGWSSAEATRTALAAAGVEDPPTSPPFVVGPWPELTAKLVRRLLGRTGAVVELADAEAGTGWSA